MNPIMFNVNLEGLEMIAVLVLAVVFVKVLEKFGLLEAGYDGKTFKLATFEWLLSRLQG